MVLLDLLQHYKVMLFQRHSSTLS